MRKWSGHVVHWPYHTHSLTQVIQTGRHCWESGLSIGLNPCFWFSCPGGGGFSTGKKMALLPAPCYMNSEFFSLLSKTLASLLLCLSQFSLIFHYDRFLPPILYLEHSSQTCSFCNPFEGLHSPQTYLETVCYQNKSTEESWGCWDWKKKPHR